MKNSFVKTNILFLSLILSFSVGCNKKDKSLLKELLLHNANLGDLTKYGPEPTSKDSYNAIGANKKYTCLIKGFPVPVYELQGSTSKVIDDEGKVTQSGNSLYAYYIRIRFPKETTKVTFAANLPLSSVAHLTDGGCPNDSSNANLVIGQDYNIAGSTITFTAAAGGAVSMKSVFIAQSSPAAGTFMGKTIKREE